MSEHQFSIRDPRHEPAPGDVFGYFDGETPIIVRVYKTTYSVDGTRLVSYTAQRRDWRVANETADVVGLPFERWPEVAARWDVLVVGERQLAPLPDWVGSAEPGT